MRNVLFGIIMLSCTCLFAGQVLAGTTSWEEFQGKAEKLYQEGKWDQAYQLAKKAAATAKDIHGECHINTAKSLKLQSEICGARGCVSQGVLLQKQVLKIQERVFGRNHPNVVKSLTVMADFLRCDGKSEKAGALYKDALERAETGGWGSSSCIVPAVEGMACLHMLRGELADAAALYKKALTLRELRRKYNPAEDLGIAGDLVCLADISRDQLKYQEASKLYRRALAKYRIVEGPGSPMTANTLKSLGELYAQWGKPARAIACLKRAIASYEKSGLRNGPMLGSTLITLASIYRGQKRHAQAEALYKKATAIYERTTGIDKAVASRLLKNARIWPGKSEEGI